MSHTPFRFLYCHFQGRDPNKEASVEQPNDAAVILVQLHFFISKAWRRSLIPAFSRLAIGAKHPTARLKAHKASSRVFHAAANRNAEMNNSKASHCSPV